MTSPTFTIGHRYAGRLTVSHLDLYRFEGISEAEWGDLEPYFDDAIVFVEWPEAGAGRLPPARAEVRLAHRGGDRRLITIDDHADDLRPPTRAQCRSCWRLIPRRRSRPARSCATGTCWASGRRPPRRCSATSRRLLAGGGRRAGGDRGHRGRPRAGPLHEPAHGSRDRPRALVRARRAGRRRLDARRARRRCAGRAAARRRPPARGLRRSADGPACVRARSSSTLEPGRLCVGDGAVRYRDRARGRRAPTSRRTTTHAMSPGRATTRGSRRPAPSRTGAEPIYLRAPDADKALARGRT